MVSVPVRGSLPGATEYVTPPLPLSRLILVIVIQSALLFALQPQPPVLWTPTLPVPPSGAQVTSVGETA